MAKYHVVLPERKLIVHVYAVEKFQVCMASKLPRVVPIRTRSGLVHDLGTQAQAKGSPMTAIHLRVWRRPWSVPATPWPGWPPRPSRAHGVPEGRSEGRSQGGNAVGHPPLGVAPAVAVMSPGGLCGGGHKVPRTRGYLSKPDSPEKAIRPDG
ncbi:hypothetical protein TIFTF001_053101 [Ficus carica]|uniref:Uncharacterized protein n=2 Tax=Ficus carica TaxID=3494 RepID=A0AA88JIW5_FICCA|nr:hypothetical protein TIFTF001_053101 [Ficus carica]